MGNKKVQKRVGNNTKGTKSNQKSRSLSTKVNLLENNLERLELELYWAETKLSYVNNILDEKLIKLETRINELECTILPY